MVSIALEKPLSPTLSPEAGERENLINTHLQVGVMTAELYPNRFNGFSLVSPSAARACRACMYACDNRGRNLRSVSETLARNR